MAEPTRRFLGVGFEDDRGLNVEVSVDIQSGDDALLAYIAWDDSTAWPDRIAIDPGGADESFFTSQGSTAVNNGTNCRMWYLDTTVSNGIPSAGTYTVRGWDNDGNDLGIGRVLAVWAFQGAAQNGSVHKVSDAIDSDTDVTDSVTTEVDECAIISAVIGSSNNSVTADTGQTEDYEQITSFSASGGSYKSAPTAGAYSMGHTCATAQRVSQQTVAIAPAATGTPPDAATIAEHENTDHTQAVIEATSFDSEATEHELYRGTSSISGSAATSGTLVIDNADPSSLMVDDTVNSNTTYFYVLVSTNAEGSTESNEIQIDVPAEPSDPISQLTDSFDDNSIDASKWQEFYVGSTSVGVAETNQQLEITPLESTSGINYGFLESVDTWDLTGNAWPVEAVTVDTPGSEVTIFELWETGQQSDQADETGLAIIADGPGITLYFQYILNGSKTTVGTLTYDSTDHRWWRIRHDSGTDRIHWETSPDGSTWTSRADVSTPAVDITNLHVGIGGGTYGETVGPTTLVFDNAGGPESLSPVSQSWTITSLWTRIGSASWSPSASWQSTLDAVSKSFTQVTSWLGHVSKEFTLSTSWEGSSALTVESVLQFWDAGFRGVEPVFGGVPRLTRGSIAYSMDHQGLFHQVPASSPVYKWRRIRGTLRPCFSPQPAATNVLERSVTIDSNPPWTVNAADVFDATSVFHDRTAKRFVDQGTQEFSNVEQISGQYTGDQETLSVIIENVNAKDSGILMWDETPNEIVARLNYNWADDRVILVEGEGFTSRHILSEQGPNGGRVVRLVLSAIGEGDNSRLIRLHPTDPGVLSTNEAIIHHVQQEELPYETAPIVSTVTTTSRASDDFFWEGGPRWQQMLVYVDMVYPGSSDDPVDWKAIAKLGSSTTTDPYLRLLALGGGTGVIEIGHFNEASDVQVTTTTDVTGGLQPNDPIEIFGILYKDGSVRVIVVKKGFVNSSSRSPTPEAGTITGGFSESFTVNQIENAIKQYSGEYARTAILNLNNISSDVDGAEDSALVNEVRNFINRIQPNGNIV